MNTIQNKMLFKMDLKRNKLSLLLWTLISCAGIILLEMLLCAVLPIDTSDPELAETAAQTGTSISSMFYQLMPIGYYSSSISSTLMSIVAFFTSAMAMMAWAQEEKDGTAELLVQMPLSRKDIWFTKFLSLFTKFAIFMGSILVTSVLSVVAVGGIENCMPTAKEMFVFIFSFIAPFTQGFVVLCFMFFFTTIRKKTTNGFSVGITIAFVFGQVIWVVITNIIATSVFNKVPDWYSIVNLPIVPSMNTINGAIGGSKTIGMTEFWVGIASLTIWIVASISVLIVSYKKFQKREIVG